MEGSVEKFEARMPQGWGKLIGTLIRASDLDETTRATSGLIVLETASGTEAAPGQKLGGWHNHAQSMTIVAGQRFLKTPWLQIKTSYQYTLKLSAMQ
jgi:hypothetical protein